MSIHILFADGSNPYLRYNMTPVEFAEEVLKWSKDYDLVFDKTYGIGVVQIMAKEKRQ